MTKEQFELMIANKFSHIAVIRNADIYNDNNGQYTQITVVNERNCMTFKNYFSSDTVYAWINNHWIKIR